MRRAMFLGMWAWSSIATASVASAQLTPTPRTAPPGAAAPVAPADDAAPVATGVSASDSVGVPVGPQEAERQAVWNSPEMQDARAWVLEYGRRSKQMGESRAREYLARVERLTPTAMRAWLAELTRRRLNLTQSAAATQYARERSVEYTFSRLQALEQARAAAAQTREMAAAQQRDQQALQQQFTGERAAIRQAARDDALWNMYYSRDYSRLAFPDRNTKIAAMYMLPGDLPAGDPRNFIRGDVPFTGSDVVDANGLPVNAAAGAAAGAGAGGAGAVGAAGAGEGGP
jgi:hypothetical protein